MSILIKGMDMPENCYECNMCRAFFEPNQGYCCDAICSQLDKNRIQIERDRGCPLVEVKPHGDLIDRDELHIELMDKELDQLQPWTSFGDYREVIQMIDDAPVVLDAQPVVYGKWSDKQVSYRDEYGDLYFGYQCSVCGAILNRTNYCGACGAKMESEE